MLVTEYELQGPDKMDVAIVADLHEHRADEVLEILKFLKPDLIAVPGDLFENIEDGINHDQYETDLGKEILYRVVASVNRLFSLGRKEESDVQKENSYEFLRKANLIAPVIMSLGNHELYLTEEDRNVISETGTELLNNSFIEKNSIVFGGIPSKQNAGTLDYKFLEEFKNHAQNKVLMCHHPEYFDEVKSYTDLVISGHCHGGQIRLFGKGVFSPGQGFWPDYVHGIYNQKMIVSAGCANTSALPRWGNPCEVVILRFRHTDS